METEETSLRIEHIKSPVLIGEIYVGQSTSRGCAVLHVLGLMSTYYWAKFQLIGVILARLNSNVD
jgi:hypothetical protein